MVKSFDDHICNLRRDGDWGGNPEITALSGIFKCFFEVYKHSAMLLTILTSESDCSIRIIITVSLGQMVLENNCSILRDLKKESLRGK